MADRALTKELGGAEDLLWGTGSVSQERASGTKSITKIDASIVPYQGSQTLRTKLGKKVEILTNVLAMQTLPVATEAERYVFLLGYSTPGDNGGGLFWLDTTDTSSAQDLSIVFNPDDLTKGRWKRVDTSKQISPDNGDADSAITAFGPGLHLHATTLTADRVVSLPVTDLYKGLTKTVVRTDAGAFKLDIGSPAVASIPSGGKKSITVTYTGSAWIKTAESTLA